jgi:hypothetical protein
MDARWGEFLYWIATILAGLIVAVALAGYFSNAAAGEPIIPVVALLLAGAIWLIGWVCRNAIGPRR